MRKVNYELVEKLGRLQSMNQKVDVGYVPFRATPIETPPTGRGTYMFSLFNPLAVARSDITTIRVYTNNITLVRVDKDMLPHGKQPKFTLVKVQDGNAEEPSTYDMHVTVPLLPHELATFLLSEYPPLPDADNFSREIVVQPASQFVLKEQNGAVSLTINFDRQFNRTGEIIIQGAGGVELVIRERLVYYGGSMTHSCVYLFNPLDNKTTVEQDLTLVNITKLKTYAFT
jgi:hypothetical protein